MTVLDMSDDELLAMVEEDAAAGDPRAESCSESCSRSSRRRAG
jgi:hypothetical protein